MAKIDLSEPLRAAGFVIAKDIPVTVEIYDEGVIVSWYDIAEFGQGQTLEEALLDFTELLTELCSVLFEASDTKLGADLQRVKATLSQYIQPITYKVPAELTKA